MDAVHGHTVLHNDPLVAVQLREARNAHSTVRDRRPLQGAGAAAAMSGEGARCTATTKSGKRCRNPSTNFGDSTLCGVHTRSAMGQSEMADIRAYRSQNTAAGPGMYRDDKGTWVVDESIRLEDGSGWDDAIELFVEDVLVLHIQHSAPFISHHLHIT